MCLVQRNLHRSHQLLALRLTNTAPLVTNFSAKCSFKCHCDSVLQSSFPTESDCVGSVVIYELHSVVGNQCIWRAREGIYSEKKCIYKTKEKRRTGEVHAVSQGGQETRRGLQVSRSTTRAARGFA